MSGKRHDGPIALLLLIPLALSMALLPPAPATAMTAGPSTIFGGYVVSPVGKQNVTGVLMVFTVPRLTCGGQRLELNFVAFVVLRYPGSGPNVSLNATCSGASTAPIYHLEWGITNTPTGEAVLPWFPIAGDRLRFVIAYSTPRLGCQSPSLCTATFTISDLTNGRHSAETQGGYPSTSFVALFGAITGPPPPMVPSLPNFHSVHVAQAQIALGGALKPITSFKPILARNTLVGDVTGDVMATPTSLSTTGGFTLTWVSTGP